MSQLLLKKPLVQLLNASGTEVGVESWTLPEDKAALQAMAPSRAEQFFIVKPNLESGGTGISIHHGLESVLPLDDCVVQPLLQDPVLFNGRKADFRVYVLILNGQGDNYRTFLFKQAYARVAGDPYVPISAASLKKAAVYLTNDAVGRDKNALDELIQPIQSVIPAEHLQSFLNGVGTLVRKTVSAVMHEVHRLPEAPVPAEHTYQLLGFDVFASRDFSRLALLEVNSKPCVGCDLDKSEVLKEVNTNALFLSLLLGGNAGDNKVIDEVAKVFSDLVVEV